MGPPHNEVFDGASGLVRCSSLDVLLMHWHCSSLRLYRMSFRPIGCTIDQGRKETLMHDLRQTGRSTSEPLLCDRTQGREGRLC